MSTPAILVSVLTLLKMQTTTARSLPLVRLPVNQTLSTNSSVFGNLPDPYAQHVPDTPMTVQFYGYHGDLAGLDMLQPLVQAMQDVPEARREPIGRWQLIYTFNNVHLHLYPDVDMTWEMWTWGLEGMYEFVDFGGIYEEFNFRLLCRRKGQIGNSEVGWGALVNDELDAVIGTRTAS
ncbi:hypothetical protein ACLMJK_005659 [Lecanora helva]